MDIWYTQGYNSRVYLLFALPLALGIESFVENLDIKLNTPVVYTCVSERINGYLPAGIEVFDHRVPVRKHSEIEAARYLFDVRGGSDYIGALINAYNTLENLDGVIMEKPGKKRNQSIDIKKQIRHTKYTTIEDGILIDAMLDSGSQSYLNPHLLFRWLTKSAEGEPRSYRIIRTGVYVSNGENFE